jgi:hypothetical protein
MLPGEARQVEIAYPAPAARRGPVSMALRGWNVSAAPVSVAAP